MRNVFFERYELLPYFDVVVGSELDGRRTDKGEVITEALRQLEIQEKQKPEVLIGDRLHDMVGAGKNQIDKLGVYYGYAHITENSNQPVRITLYIPS